MRNTGIKIILILVVSFSSFGQNNFKNGFIVNLENDTIVGQVDYRTNSENYISCLFKTEKDIKKYFPKDILGFGYKDDKYFSSQIIKDTFVEALVLGEMSLYKYKNDTYLIKKDDLVYTLESKKEKLGHDGKNLRRETVNWKGTLTLLVIDCIKNPNEIISKNNLSEKSLVDLVVKYNTCKNTDFIEFNANKPWGKVDFGATLGLSQTELTFVRYDWSFSNGNHRSFDPYFGFFIEISSPRQKERLSSRIGINFMKTTFSNENTTSSIELTTLSMPFTLSYNLPIKSLTLSFQGGGIMNYHVNSKEHLISSEIKDFQIGVFDI